MTNELDKIEAALKEAIYFMRERDVLRDTRVYLEEALTTLTILRKTHIMIARDDVPDDLSHILEDGRGYDQFDRIQIFMDLSALIQKEMDK